MLMIAVMPSQAAGSVPANEIIMSHAPTASLASFASLASLLSAKALGLLYGSSKT